MSISVNLLQSAFPADKIKYSFDRLAHLVSAVIIGLTLPCSTTATEVINPTARPNLDPISPPIPFLFPSKPTISPGEARLMTQELRGSIDRFRATLLTADALASDVDLSTESTVRQILGSGIATGKQANKIDTKYQASHLALHRASLGLKKFNHLVKQRRYEAARREWSSAREILGHNYPQDRQLATAEVRAMWFDRGTIVKAKSPEDLVELFDRIALAGINTIFFETINSSYTIYPSQVAPQQNPLVKGWDPLEAAIELAHERDIELHAWIWTFAAVNKRHNTILNLPRHHLGPVLSQRPEWAMTDHQGSRFHYNSAKVFFDPANPEVRGYLQALINEIATKYDVDGIHLDYIRYPFQSSTGKITYGYGASAREQFEHQTGYDPVELNPYHPLWSSWIEFRTEQIDSFVEEVSQQLKEIDPELTLSTAVFPIPQRDRLAKIQQGWETWVSREWIDMLVPMTYARDTERLNTLASPLLREFTQGKALLLPGIRLLNMSEIVALDQMQFLRGLATEGYALFAVENLDRNLATVFNQTQGNNLTAPQQLPHRQPFLAARSRYQSLKQEWNFFLTTNPTVLNEATALEWGKQADRLSEKLARFIADPSSKNLFSLQITLNSLRQQFPYWMEETKAIDTYQVQVWQNRLDTLDRLLSYGVRKRLS